jgi:adenylosuccinate synthase
MQQPQYEDINEVKMDVEILKRDVSDIRNLLGRLDTAIDKIADASNGISKILAVHDQRLEINAEDIDERKRLSEKETELLHRRISEMKDESAEHHKNNHREVMTAISNMGERVDDKLTTLGDRVTLLERWKWWVMGGSWAIGFIIATLLQVGGFITKLGG